MKLKLILLASVFALGFAFNANAGAVVDGDSDLVPDVYDNCDALANGPNETSNQVDSNQDGYGNACDTDYNNDGQTTVGDFSFFFEAFTNAPVSAPATAADIDHNGDGSVTVGDFAPFFARFSVSPPGSPGNAPGTSGLTCAGTIPCLP